MNKKPQRYLDFFDRLYNRIAEVQQTSPDKISVALAAREMGVPETTVRSTLEGRCPSSPDYWRRWKAYLRCDLDWLICGQGDRPLSRSPKEPELRILIVEKDLETSKLLGKCCTKASRNLPFTPPTIDLAMTMAEAVSLIGATHYDLILSGTRMDWSAEALALIKRVRFRPRLTVVATDGNHSNLRLIGLVDQSLVRLSSLEVIQMIEDQLTLLADPVIV